jgi:pimeloyl-ACP methyl ester carboxylesterase
VESLPKKRSSKTSFARRVAFIMLAVAACAVLLAIGLVMTFEDRFIFFPSKYPDGFWEVEKLRAVEGEIGPRIEDCFFKASDGIQLHGWFCSPVVKGAQERQPVQTEMVLLWFHGNAGNISYRYDMIRMLMGLPVRVFIIDYRGYGRSEGSPSERGIYQDGRAAWDYLVSERGVKPENIIIFGKSLGGAVAIDLATQVEPAGLIVQSSFTSARDMAARVLPLFPPFLIHTKLDSIRKIGGVRCTKLFIHSRADEVVPYELGRRLYEAAPEPKKFYDVEDAPHNSTYIVGGKAYLDALRKFIESCMPR